MFSFSIIIPIYNSNVNFFKKCLNSVKEQTYKNFECILIDDGSTNQDILDELNKLLKNDFYKLIKQENKGLGPARNTGLLNSKNDYIVFLDADDWLEKNALEIINENLEEGLQVINYNFSFVYKDLIAINDSYFSILLNKTNWGGATSWSKAYNRSFLLNNNIFFIDSKNPHEDEPHWLLVCFYLTSYKSINNNVLFYNKTNDNSITKNVHIVDSFKFILTYIYSLKDIFLGSKPSALFIEYVNINLNLYFLPIGILVLSKINFRQYKDLYSKISFLKKFIRIKSKYFFSFKKICLKLVYLNFFSFAFYLFFKVFKKIIRKRIFGKRYEY